MVAVRCLVSDTVETPALKAEHGLAFWVESNAVRLLFDTGQGAALAPNAKQLGVDLAFVEAVAFSHGHYDHTGGLPAAVGAAHRLRLYAHPDAFQPKFALRKQNFASIGLPDSARSLLTDSRVQVVETRTPVEFAPGYTLTGEIPRAPDAESASSPFCLTPNTTCPDPFRDDQALFFTTAEGVVVLLGCAHAGVENTLRYVTKLAGADRLHAVIGGMHLHSASAERVQRVVDTLRDLQVQLIGPTHCTGERATAALRTAFPEKCFPCGAGTSMLFS